LQLDSIGYIYVISNYYKYYKYYKVKPISNNAIFVVF